MTDSEATKHNRYDGAEAKEKALRQSNSAMNPRKIAITGKELSQTATVTTTAANAQSLANAPLKDQGPYFKNAAIKKRAQARSQSLTEVKQGQSQ